METRKTRTRTGERLLFEPVERRELLSAAHMHALFGAGFFGGHDHGRGGDNGFGNGGFPPGAVFRMLGAGQTITFSEAPAAVQTGLTTLASTEGLSAPTADQRVTLGNKDGVETYTIVETGTGISARLTVDVAGASVTPPTKSTVTFGTIPDAAAASEISAIVTALNLTAPDPAATVNVSTPATGPAVYTISIARSSGHGHVSISVDANGNPVGNESLPLSALPAAIQTGLTHNAPANTTALTPTSIIVVRTQNGVTTYSARYTGTGIRATVTVDEAGSLTSLPSTTTVQFSTIPAPAQTELQTLATDAGVTGTIDPTQNVQAYDEANGTTIYSVRVTAQKTGHSGGTFSYLVMLSVDQAGNPTVLPSGGGEGFFGGFGWC